MTVARLLGALLSAAVMLASAPLGAENTGWELPKLPAYKLPMGRDWYPMVARANGWEGRVLVGFDIMGDGRAKNISVIWAEDREYGVFAKNTRELLGALRYEVPADWAVSGAQRRWRLGVVYCLTPSGQPADFAIPVEELYINASRLRGVPVRTSPAPGASGLCGPR